MRIINTVNYVLVAFVTVLIGLSAGGCGSSKAKALREQLKPGMSASEGAELLRSNKDSHYHVRILGQQEIRPFTEFERLLNEASKQENGRVVVNVLFMGPAFFHNDFDILEADENRSPDRADSIPTRGHRRPAPVPADVVALREIDPPYPALSPKLGERVRVDLV
jgi:hypothetical protein